MLQQLASGEEDMRGLFLAWGFPTPMSPRTNPFRPQLATHAMNERRGGSMRRRCCRGSLLHQRMNGSQLSEQNMQHEDYRPGTFDLKDLCQLRRWSPWLTKAFKACFTPKSILFLLCIGSFKWLPFMRRRLGSVACLIYTIGAILHRMGWSKCHQHY